MLIISNFNLISVQSWTYLFVKEKPELWDNYFCTGITEMNNGLPINFVKLRISTSCDGRVSKFPIQSLLLFMVKRRKIKKNLLNQINVRELSSRK